MDGLQYPLFQQPNQATLVPAGTELETANNTAQTVTFIAHKQYLPTISHN